MKMFLVMIYAYLQNVMMLF